MILENDQNTPRTKKKKERQHDLETQKMTEITRNVKND